MLLSAAVWQQFFAQVIKKDAKNFRLKPYQKLCK